MLQVRGSVDENSYSGYGVVVGGDTSWKGVTFPVGSTFKAVNRPRNGLISWNVEAEPSSVSVGEWSTIEISAIGNRITTFVNERKIAEYTDGASLFKSGRITLSCWQSSIQFKETLIQELHPKKDGEPQ